ncbi:MAG: nucleotide sugar dehydrogenase [Candidatus Marinimicrobia bacterium]|nr:nucleotide sugar dehydrogenase [Candidatus Neomarinimicrobiota bacterium]MBT4155125.1 nucleotide sugar dehydrogenase [Candidatus Neomarinimicrobiota bacterium]MBT4555386.1 nucleotide sugar dehydrogenase [Candidatus Neomarinimicrobiota bacterium]MBT4752480.1 nucleotide sugar dehydrogenase [Candidatus Neomarinimicrobiota bacterium]MBT5115124.1 nucleotide sugar dehydrogenase [Candidatus Neomarinimicrobiota bacterium]|tara:strand:+ start:12991 stop:14298 length:1308 start_codon:yes stop_codon:yes gene_type:complete
MNLKNIIDNREAQIGVIGLGYVGLPLAIEFVHAGFTVTGIDIDELRVKTLNEGNNYIQDVSDKHLRDAVENNKFSASTEFSVIKNLDCVIICVPTPLNKQKNPDVSFINSAIKEIKKYIHPNMLVVLESTTYPGTTRELVAPELESTDLKIGQDFYLCFSPERIDPGNTVYNTANTPKVLGGITPNCGKIGECLYETIVSKVVLVSSPETAEMVKLLENTFRAINIGLANEVAIMCEKLGIDVWEVIDAAATKPFGYMKFTPGPGLGGHCIPIDPHYLSWKLKTLDYNARFIQLAGEINTSMPFHVVDLVRAGLNRNQKSISGCKIIVIGVAYKKNVNDVRESPALDVMRLLVNDGAELSFHDPFVPNIKLNGSQLDGLSHLTEPILNEADAVVIMTDHDQIDFDFIEQHGNLIIDTRNSIKKSSASVIKLGVGN